MAYTTLCDLSELTPGEGHYVEVGVFKLAVYLDADRPGEVFALDDECPHARGSLGRGWVDRGCAVCPLHAWAFDLKSGSMRASPGVKVRTYPTRLKDVGEGRVVVQAELPGY